MRAVVYSGTGGVDVMAFEERPDPVPGSSEILVEVRYAGVNPADLAQREGRYPPPPGAPADVPGLEVAGTVVATGDAVQSWKEGDRVFGIVAGGGLADRVIVHERHVTRVPENLGEREAAAVPEAFLTAHDAVFTQARMRMGDLLLVNGANGGVGTAAGQLGRAAGARVFGTVRSDDARERIAELGLEPLDPTAFVEPLQKLGGTDVVLELVGAPNLPADLEALAVRGRVVVVGTGAGTDADLSLRALMGKRARLFGTVLRARPLEEKAAAVQAFAHEVVPHLADGRVKPIVDRVFPAAEAAEAFDYLARPGKFGKVLLGF